MRIVTTDGQTPLQGVLSILQRVLNNIRQDGAKILQDSLLYTTQRHVQTIYPGSKHYNPDNVEKGDMTSGGQTLEAEIKIDIPGICRAYHDHNIKPITAKHLTIPMHQSAYGKKAGSIPGLVYIKKKNGKEFLAKKIGGKLTFMYFLAKEVHQKQDERLMPTDETYINNFESRLRAYLMRKS